MTYCCSDSGVLVREAEEADHEIEEALAEPAVMSHFKGFRLF